MSINLKKRMTTGPTTAFVSCTQLPVREDIISKQAMVSYNGGGGGRGGSRQTTSSSNAGRVAQVGGTYEPDTGGVTRRTQQLMEGAVLSNPRSSNNGYVLPSSYKPTSIYTEAYNAMASGADALGDAASECWDSATDYAGQLCSLSTWRGLAGLP